MNQKILIVFVVIIGLASANIPSELDIAPRAGINDQILKFIENLKDRMPCGMPELGVPILAPLEKEYAEVQLSKNLIEIMLSAFDIHVDGLNNFEVNSVALSILTLKFKFDFTFKEIHLKSQYVANAILLKLIRIKGNGDADITLKDLRIVGEAQIGATTKDLYLRNFKITIVLGQFKSDITGLLWGKYTGKLANSMIQRFVPIILKYKHDDVAEIVQEIVINTANEQLKGVSIKDLLDLINNHEPIECIPPTKVSADDSISIAMDELKQVIGIL